MGAREEILMSTFCICISFCSLCKNCGWWGNKFQSTDGQTGREKTVWTILGKLLCQARNQKIEESQYTWRTLGDPFPAAAALLDLLGPSLWPEVEENDTLLLLNCAEARTSTDTVFPTSAYQTSLAKMPIYRLVNIQEKTIYDKTIHCR